jgi:enoyl-CoA hydratase
MEGVVTSVEGRAGFVTLDRPAALNALTLPMIRGLAAAITAHVADPRVAWIVIRSTHAKAFCAGGDMRRIRELSLAGEFDAAHAFFDEEYAVNAAIARCPKPWVALMDGITMGGGLGLTVHGSHRIVTEHAVLAMPEMAIGFLPDVGGTWFLPRMPQRAGFWMGLSGARVTGAEAVRVGLATHFVPRDALPALVAALSAPGSDTLDAILARFATQPDLAAFDAKLARIAHWFGADTLDGLHARLAADASPEAAECRAQMANGSPASQAFAFDVMTASGPTLEACLARELAATRHVIRHPDFIEGVRAVLVDKDRQPKWSGLPHAAA